MIQKIPVDQVPAAFGKINNQFVGILVGIISAELYNRFSGVELPKALSFFSGRRLYLLTYHKPHQWRTALTYYR